MNMSKLKVTNVIGLVQTKGGAGRTTLATNLAGELSKLGTVALIDCHQPQGTASSWASLRFAFNVKNPLRTFYAASRRDLISWARQLLGQVEWLVLDGPPRNPEMTQTILMLADLNLVPLSGSPVDVWATSDLLPVIETARDFRLSKIRLAWNGFRSYTTLAQQMEQQAGKVLKLKALQTRLGYRMAYVEALGSGHTVAELRDRTARLEISNLVAEVRSLLKRKASKPLV